MSHGHGSRQIQVVQKARSQAVKPARCCDKLNGYCVTSQPLGQKQEQEPFFPVLLDALPWPIAVRGKFIAQFSACQSPHQLPVILHSTFARRCSLPAIVPSNNLSLFIITSEKQPPSRYFRTSFAQISDFEHQSEPFTVCVERLWLLPKSVIGHGPFLDWLAKTQRWHPKACGVASTHSFIALPACSPSHHFLLPTPHHRVAIDHPSTFRARFGLIPGSS